MKQVANFKIKTAKFATTTVRKAGRRYEAGLQMTANELISLIPKHVFDDLSAETKVDHAVKKPTGEVMFKLLLFSMLSTNKLSLRVMESLLHSVQFKVFYPL